MKRAYGFSLLEVMMAITLLAAGLALALSALHAATRSTDRAERQAQDDERLRAAQSFLRRQLADALPIAYAVDSDTGNATLFQGGRDSLNFVGSLPGYLSYGGAYLQTLRLVRGDRGYRLEYSFRQLTADGPLAPERRPEVLFDGIANGEFGYRALDGQGHAQAWRTDWRQASSMPALVRIRLHPEDARRSWPELVVAPRMSSGVASGQEQGGDLIGAGSH